MSLCGPVGAEEPLSAIDWLSKSVVTPAAPKPTLPPEPAIATSGGALPADVLVSVLDGASPDGAGLLPPDVTGLPRNLWGFGETQEIAKLIGTERAEALPALQELFRTILLAETAPPPDAGGRGQLLLARIDKLLAMGALNEAESLIEVSGKMTPDLFRRNFDVALLTGHEDQACQSLKSSPNLAPTYPVRIFCIARSGDWNSAALTLRVAQALGAVSDAEDAMMSRFLDPDLYEGEPALPPPSPMTPLVWRILEAIGEGVPTQNLPLAFSHAELRETAGWKAQIEAAERLTKAGVLDPNALIGIYSARMPAASGGVWDRVEAFQRFDTALTAGDPGAVAKALPAVWDAMTAAELEVAFAALFTGGLMRLPLSEPAAGLAFRVAMLSPDYERAALARTPVDQMEAFLIALARGNLQGVTPPDSLARAIAPAFLRADPPADLASLLADNRMGEALLLSIDRIVRGLEGDLRGVSDGLAFLRHVGLEDVARRTALQLMLLERRG
jgi:hypothetical protein